MQGRPPKPTEQKRREGNPGKRQLPDSVLVGGRGDPERPKGLDTDGKHAWDALVADLGEDGSGILDTADWPSLEGCAVSVGLARQLRRKRIGAERAAAKAERTAAKASGAEDVKEALEALDAHEARFLKLYRAERDAWGEARQHMDRLGLGPVGRSRLGLSGGKGKGREDEFNDNVGDSPRARLRAVEGGQP